MWGLCSPGCAGVAVPKDKLAGQVLVVRVLLPGGMVGTLLLRWLNSWSGALASEPGLVGGCRSMEDE